MREIIKYKRIHWVESNELDFLFSKIINEKVKKKSQVVMIQFYPSAPNKELLLQISNHFFTDRWRNGEAAE